ncbi:MAG: hypothetical protein C0404_11220 [Verrucomicrobia bacterium]|nr:hypothetical protein [Verrucomicrobiota bacterium]
MKQMFAGVFLVLAVYAAHGDQLVVTGQSKDGAFQGFENGKFSFLTTKGRFLKEQAMRVTKMTLNTPMKASYSTTDGKDEQDVVLKGYDKSKFIFAGKDGKEITVAVAKIKSIDLSFDDGGAGGGSIKDGTGYPIPKVDPDSFGGELTQDQQAALDKFKAAKKNFDDFLGESSAMVQQMDKMTGAKREDFLNKLRSRKNEEQPLKRDLVAAYKSLVGAFPDAPEENTRQPSKVAKPPETKQATSKAVETAHVDSKAADARTSETKAGAPKSVDLKPASTKPADGKTIELNVDLLEKRPDKLEF